MMYLGMYSNCWEKNVQSTDTTVHQHNKKGEWPKDFIEVTMIAFKKKPEATKHNYLTISLNTHTTEIVVAILRRMIEKKTEDIH